MELCTIRGVLSTPPLPLSPSHRFFPDSSNLRFSIKNFSHFPGIVSLTNKSTLLRVNSDESSNKFTDEKSDSAFATLEDEATVDNFAPVIVSVKEDEGVYDEMKQSEQESEVGESSSDNEFLQPLKELLNKLNVELDVEDSPTYLLYGGGGLVAVWLLSAIIGAIDSIPVFPKLMEVVGLGYTVWFTTRYLLFKKNREEFGSKIDEFKSEIFGSSDK
ncbi:protein CURVATURE THYLAKOID 1D, chloroplastic [Beta vulgaris subsp. vulgaris]|uniref:protein CURVATURE THYLAKOID 1D, chloroplastic n=1 Tax=Beta vulgaris subsp. vulgaris TaxID=3555 RepID=UPI002036DCF6|nr:protein CURVATURE THYLAKOID 1D, chloroplastic [Beta vulgaris subsp. vulgaris]